MRLFCCQFDIAWEDKPENFRRVRSMLASEPVPRGSLILLPEMFATGFSMNVEAIAESAGGPTGQFLGELARESGAFIVGGVAIRGDDGRVRNEAVAFDPAGAMVARYAKRRTFTPGGESDHMTRGEEVVVFDWCGCRVALAVCYDLRFPELFRSAVEQGAELYAVIANWPTARVEHWLKLLQARAIENQAIVAGVNRCGTDPSIQYPGRSVIVGPAGEMLAEAADAPAMIGADVHIDRLREYRKSFPVLDDK